MTTEHTTTTTNLTDLARRVAQLRKRFVAAKWAQDEAYCAWVRDHQPLMTESLEAAQALKDAEDALRSLALAHYQADGNKHPGPGLAIRVTTKFSYLEADALKWAKDHDIALKLDVSTFEKLAKATPPDFVRVTEVASATIATDLDAALAEPTP